MRNLLLLFLLSFLVSCSTASFKASEAPDAGFIENAEKLSENRDRAPFHKYWNKNEDLFFTEIRKEPMKVFLHPIDTSLFLNKVKKDYAEEDFQDIEDEANSLAKYLYEKFFLVAKSQNAIKLEREYKENYPVLQLSLVEINPTKPIVNLLSTVASFFIPGSGLLSYFGEGSVAMEGKVSFPNKQSIAQVLSEEGSKEDVDKFEVKDLPSFNYLEWAAFKDKEGQQIRFFSFKDYQKYAHIRLVLDDWAMQIVELITTKGDHRVDDTSLLSLNPL